MSEIVQQSYNSSMSMYAKQAYQEEWITEKTLIVATHIVRPQSQSWR